MSVTVVVELSHELHRLAVAGTGLAKGDRRVAALVPALEKSGEKVPVFARIAERTNALLAASKAAAPAEFLQLNTLVGAVLRTQGRSGVDGEIESPAASATTAKRIPMRALNELRDGLWSGRNERLDHAIERGWFGDARLAPFALEALGSDDAALANLAARKLVPPYGKAIVPLLLASFDPSLKRSAARVIETIGRIDAGSGTALARQILDPQAERVFELATDGVKISDETFVAALGLLDDHVSDRGVLLDALDSRKKAVRVAALSRLLALGDTDAEARAVAMLGGSVAKSREAIEAIPSLGGPAMAGPVVDRAHALATALRAKKPATADANDAVRVLSLLARSEPSPERFDAAFALSERFDTIRSHAGELRPEIVRGLFDYLVEACPSARHRPLARLVLRLEPRLATLAVLRRFGPVDTLSFLKLGDAKNLKEGLRGVFPRDPDGRSHRGTDLPPPSAWNREWLELGFRHELNDLVDYLWSVDPAMVVERILAKRKLYGEDALRALIADPACAGTLRPKLARDGDDPACFDLLCRAIAAGDHERSLELAGAVPDHSRRELRVALQTRLADHFSGNAA